VSEVLHVQVETLLARVHDAARRARWELESDADAQVRAIVADARHRARATVRAAAREKRERVADRCRRARAAAETHDRAASFAREAHVARTVRAALPAALERRWREAATRREWCRAALSVAARMLIAREWRLSIAAGATADDRATLTNDAALAGIAVHVCDACVERAGLRIDGGRVTVDASVAGLLADTDAIEARALALLGERRSRERTR
jgi:hypothetical protein